MAIKAYLMIRVKKGFCQNNGLERILSDLDSIPEVKYIEQVDGICDLLVQIEAPVRAVFVAHKVLVMDWVERLFMLKVVPFSINKQQELAFPEMLYKTERHIIVH